LRWLLAVLLILLVGLQYRLWIAQGSLAERHRLQGQIEEQIRINSQLQERNTALEREVLDLQTGNKGLEQRAREQLGLIRQGETFYRFVDKPAATTAQAAPAATPAPAAPTPAP
jgi:cell division protein FtsB